MPYCNLYRPLFLRVSTWLNIQAGIATQNPSRNNAIVVTDKARRVANFHHETVKNLVELIGAAGLNNVEDLRPEHINCRVQGTEVKNYAQLCPQLSFRPFFR